MKIAVGGMIGSGKSTLVEKLGAVFNLPVMEEFEKDDEVFNTLLRWLYEGRPNVEMLLQIYFINNHYLRQVKTDGNFIVDRDLIEHWIFAKTNLDKSPEVFNMYNGLFMAYMTKISKPDIYVILNIDDDTVLNRIKERGRSSEVDNLDSNVDYFKKLNSDYVDKLVAQCRIYEIPYIVVNNNDLTPDETLKVVVDKINNFLCDC